MKPFKLPLLFLFFWLFCTAVSAQVTPGSKPKTSIRKTLSPDTMLYIDHNSVAAFMNSTFSLISPSTAAPIYIGQNGLPVYADPAADPVTGKFNYQRNAPVAFLKKPDSAALHKPYTDIFYKEGGYDDTRLSAYQWLPLNSGNRITIRINSHKSSYWTNYPVQNQIAAFNVNYQKHLNKNSTVSGGVAYFRNTGYDYTATRPIPDLRFLSTFTQNYFEDYSRVFSLKYERPHLKVEAAASNEKVKTSDIFYRATSTTSADTINRRASLQLEKLSVHARYAWNENLIIGIRTQNFRVYKSRVFPGFSHYDAELYGTYNHKGIISNMHIKKRDLSSWQISGNLSKTLNPKKNLSVNTSVYYNSFLLPVTYAYLFPGNDFDYHQWQKIGGLKLKVRSILSDRISVQGSSWIHKPLNYYHRFFTEENQKISEIYYGGGISADLNFKHMKNSIFYENYSPFGTDYIQKIGYKGKLDLRLSDNIRLSGYATLIYFTEYYKTTFFYTTNEFHFYSSQENPMITNLYLTLPVKSSILFAEWVNLLQREYAFKNYDYFGVYTFKFGVIWRLWE